MSKPTWHLVNGEERNSDNPDTFELPERQLRDVLDIRGPDKVLAKLIFMADKPCPKGPFKGCHSERMWVSVQGRGETKRYVGKLKNKPHFIEGLTFDQLIEFEPENVIHVQLTPEAQEELEVEKKKERNAVLN